MLILTRKPGESLYIGDVKVVIVEVKGHQIRIGIEAPPEIRIYREEIYLQILEENRKAAEASTVSSTGLDSLTAGWKGRSQDDTGSGKRAGVSPGVLASGAGGASKESPQVVVRRKRKKEDE